MAGAERGWIAAGLAGLGLASARLVVGRWALVAAEAEPFRVEVAAPHAVQGGTWRGRVVPAELAERAALRVDGRRIEFFGREADGSIEAALAETAGLRIIEVELTRQGGRVEVVADAALAGQFVDRAAPEPRCGAALRIAGPAIERIALPPLRERLLAVAREVSLLGPETRLERGELRLTEGGIEFEVMLAGSHRIGASGTLSVALQGPRQLALGLVSLGPVVFAGSLRTKATAGGAAAGALVTGPFAPLGALAGYFLADAYVDRRARRELETQLHAGLSRASALELVPEEAELVVGEPRSRAEVRLCELALDATGIAASASLRPLAVAPADPKEAGRVSARLAAIPGPARHGVTMPALQPAAPVGDVDVELSVEAIDALVDAWTVNGLLVDLASRAGWVERVDAALTEWTTLSLAGVELRLAPSLSPGTDKGWGVALAVDLAADATADLAAQGEAAAVGVEAQVGRALLVADHELADEVGAAQEGRVVVDLDVLREALGEVLGRALAAGAAGQAVVAGHGQRRSSGDARTGSRAQAWATSPRQHSSVLVPQRAHWPCPWTHTRASG